MAETIWRKDSSGVAHAVVNKRARCSSGGFPQGKKCSPPVYGNESGYCYNCHYVIATDALPKAKRGVLTNLLNREIAAKVHGETERYRMELESREKSVATRSDENRKREDELHKLRAEADGDKEAVEVGKAFMVLSKNIGQAMIEAAYGPGLRRHYGPRW